MGILQKPLENEIMPLVVVQFDFQPKLSAARWWGEIGAILGQIIKIRKSYSTVEYTLLYSL